MAKELNGGVFGFEYLEDAELEQNDVVGCTTALRSPVLGPWAPIRIDIPQPLPLPGPIVFGPGF